MAEEQPNYHEELEDFVIDVATSKSFVSLMQHFLSHPKGTLIPVTALGLPEKEAEQYQEIVDDSKGSPFVAWTDYSEPNSGPEKLILFFYDSLIWSKVCIFNSALL